jgi:hypothetical protein
MYAEALASVMVEAGASTYMVSEMKQCWGKLFVVR